jgi:hypothetical protein
MIRLIKKYFDIQLRKFCIEKSKTNISVNHTISEAECLYKYIKTGVNPYSERNKL